jgi:hypothetical protein
VDEVGHNYDDDAEGGWGLEQEAWMGEDLWRHGLRCASTGMSGCRDERRRGGRCGEHSDGRTWEVIDSVRPSKRPIRSISDSLKPCMFLSLF